MTDISGKLKAARERVMERIRERRAAKSRTKTIPTPPRYDEVYFRGVEAMNRSAVGGDAEMSDRCTNCIVEKWREPKATSLQIDAAYDIEILRAKNAQLAWSRDVWKKQACRRQDLRKTELEELLAENENLRAENEKLTEELDDQCECNEKLGNLLDRVSVAIRPIVGKSGMWIEDVGTTERLMSEHNSLRAENDRLRRELEALK